MSLTASVLLREWSTYVVISLRISFLMVRRPRTLVVFVIIASVARHVIRITQIKGDIDIGLGGIHTVLRYRSGDELARKAVHAQHIKENATDLEVEVTSYR